MITIVLILLGLFLCYVLYLAWLKHTDPEYYEAYKARQKENRTIQQATNADFKEKLQQRLDEYKRKAQLAKVNHTVLQGQMLQCLETIYILHRSHSLDTVRSRLVFFGERLGNIAQYSESPVWQTNLQLAIDKYHSMYYDKQLSFDEIQSVKYPNDILGDYNRFKALVLISTFKNLYKHQAQMINELKTNKGKQNRLLNLIKQFDLLESEIKDMNIHQHSDVISLLAQIRLFLDDLVSKVHKDYIVPAFIR